MKCEHCGVENATFFCKTTVNGRTSQMHLCHGCAEKLGLSRSMHQAFSRPFGRLFDPFSLLGDFAHVSTPTLLTEFPAPDEAAAPPQEELVDTIDAKKLQEERQKNALQAQLRRAIDEERYEDAAKLRDELRTLN